MQEALGRPKGAAEFQAVSPKNDCPVRLYCRATFWRWSLLEFDPLSTDLRVNEIALNINSRKIRVAIAFETPESSNLVFSRHEIDADVRPIIREYAEKQSVKCEILEADYLKEHQVHAENLINMLSYISKHKDVFTKRNLDEGLRAVRGGVPTVGGACMSLELKFGIVSPAVVFELVRRGQIRIPSVASHLLSGSSILEF
jgi:hypothetical protein